MSGGAQANEKDAPASSAVPRDVNSALERLLEQEMKDDALTLAPAKCSPPTTSWNSIGARRGSGTETTWNFVQMNMSLLPIARPLPVSISNRIHDSLIGRKPRTPNQKLHHRALHNASNISPRHNEVNMLRRRGSTSSEHGTAASYTIPRQTITERQFSAPMAIPSRCGKRKSDHDDHDMSSPWPESSPFHLPPYEATALDPDSRLRSFCEDLTTQSSGTSSLDANLECFVLSRSASSSSAFAQRGPLFKDKRILEIQDEERRLRPDERATLPSPSKRTRRN